MAEYGDTGVAAGTRRTALAFEQADQQRVLVVVIVALPARGLHSWTTTQRGDAQAGVLGQRQQPACSPIRFGFQERVLPEGRASLFDVEVNA